jgi:hypothetical protein
MLRLQMRTYQYAFLSSPSPPGSHLQNNAPYISILAADSIELNINIVFARAPRISTHHAVKFVEEAQPRQVTAAR